MVSRSIDQSVGTLGAPDRAEKSISSPILEMDSDLVGADLESADDVSGVEFIAPDLDFVHDPVYAEKFQLPGDDDDESPLKKGKTPPDGVLSDSELAKLLKKFDLDTELIDLEEDELVPN